jgi:hypothetical protein
MHQGSGGLALVVALGALVLAGYVLLQDRATPSGLEAQGGDHQGESSPVATETLAELVEQAVDKKAEQLQLMQGNKKPSIDAFAKALALTEEQRAAAERAIVGSQHEIKAVLEIETADGTNFLDELVETMADGMARPGKDLGRGLKLFGRILSETIPGTSETYAARAEALKARLREEFRRAWSPKQYAAFEAWQMDPTEVKGIPGSPWTEVEARVIERAKELGAQIPDARTR